MDAERTAVRITAPISLSLVVVLSATMLAGCATSRYERGAVLAGEELTETLFLSGDGFRLERESTQGTLVFTGLLDVRENEWRFAIQSSRNGDGVVQTFAPARVYVYRGRAFENGVAFYARLSPGRSSADLDFIRAPCDFDIVR